MLIKRGPSFRGRLRQAILKILSHAKQTCLPHCPALRFATIQGASGDPLTCWTYNNCHDIGHGQVNVSMIFWRPTFFTRSESGGLSNKHVQRMICVAEVAISLSVEHMIQTIIMIMSPSSLSIFASGARAPVETSWPFSSISLWWVEYRRPSTLKTHIVCLKHVPPENKLACLGFGLNWSKFC